MKIAAVALVGLLLAGCGGAGKPPVAATPAPTTASPTPSPTPTAPPVLTMAQAKVKYLQIVAPSNATLAAFNKAAHTNVRARIQAAAAKMSAALRVFDTALLTVPWPATVAPNAAKLAEDNSGMVPLLNAMAKATTSKAFTAAYDEFDAYVARSEGSKYAELIRTQLGLPSAPA